MHRKQRQRDETKRRQKQRKRDKDEKPKTRHYRRKKHNILVKLPEFVCSPKLRKGMTQSTCQVLSQFYSFSPSLHSAAIFLQAWSSTHKNSIQRKVNDLLTSECTAHRGPCRPHSKGQLDGTWSVRLSKRKTEGRAGEEGTLFLWCT